MTDLTGYAPQGYYDPVTGPDGEVTDHDDPRTADYIAARADESLSYGDIAYAQDQGWCSSSPDGMGPHRPDDTTDPVTCAECEQALDG